MEKLALDVTRRILEKLASSIISIDGVRHIVPSAGLVLPIANFPIAGKHPATVIPVLGDSARRVLNMIRTNRKGIFPGSSDIPVQPDSIASLFGHNNIIAAPHPVEASGASNFIVQNSNQAIGLDNQLAKEVERFTRVISDDSAGWTRSRNLAMMRFDPMIRKSIDNWGKMSLDAKIKYFRDAAAEADAINLLNSGDKDLRMKALKAMNDSMGRINKNSDSKILKFVDTDNILDASIVKKLQEMNQGLGIK